MSSTRTRSDAVGWLLGVGAGVLVDAAHSVAWRVHLGHAFGDTAFAIVLALLAATPIVVTVIATLLVLSPRPSLKRGAVLFVVLGLTHVAQSLPLELFFPGMLAPVAIGGRGLGLLLSPVAFGIAVLVLWLRRRGPTEEAVVAPVEPPA